jgi:2-dehydro-3-deoxyphosphogluconate aldolase / (4S)-4-hydroxy-2-oxoglutarate aldolase
VSALDRIREIGIVPVVEAPDAGVGGPLANALCDAGIPCAEVTFRTPAAAATIAAMRSARPEMLVGAGTVLTVEQVDAALANGAAFVVSPGFGRAVVERCIAVGLPILPGACTPTEVQMALEAGLSTVKFFPAEAAGGVPFLRAMGGPFGGVRFVPTGGIGPQSLAAYLALPNVAACGGSWFVRSELLARGDFAEVRRLATEAAAIVRASR